MTLLAFSSLSVANPASPPAGWLRPSTASAGRIVDLSGNYLFGRSSGSKYAVWYDQSALGSPTISAEITVGDVASTSNSAAVLIEGDNGNGYAANVVSFGSEIEIIRLDACAKNETVIQTIASSVTNYVTKVRITLHKPTNTLKVYKDGVQIGVDSVDSTYSPVYAGVGAGGGRSTTVESSQVGAQVNSITDPIVFGSAFSWSDSGFSSPATTVSAIGLSATSVDGTAKTAVWPALADGQAITAALPATAQTVTAGNGSETATITTDFNLPAAHAPVSFASAVDDDDKFLGYHIELLDGYRGYYPTAGGLVIGAAGDIACDDPFTFTMFLHKFGGDDSITEYVVTVPAEGGVVVDPSEIIVTGLVNPATGLLQGGYVPIDPNNNWRIAAPFRLDHSYDMIAVSPRAEEAGSMAYFKWADTKSNYKCRFSWFGGEPPFRLTIRRAPLGATIGGSASQVFTRTPDVTVPEMYVHDVPENFAEIDWLPNSGMLGNTYNFSVLVEDQAGRQLVFKWATTVDDTKFKYFDSALGSDTNAGTFELPYQTIGFGFELENSNNYIFKLKDGSYPLNQSAVPNKCRSIIGIGSAAVLDTSAGGISGNFDDFAIMNCDIDGSPVTSGNFKAINVQSRSRRVLFHKLRFKNIVPTSHGDNSSCIFTVGLGTPSVNKHEYISITECSVDTTVKAQMVCTYSSDYVVVDNASGIVDIPNVPYGGKLLHFKDQSSHVSVRFPNVSGVTDNILISFANQYPINAYNQECIYARVNYTGNSAQAAISWNGQGTTAPYKGVSQYLMRASIRGGTQKPVGSESIGVGGEKLNISSCLWSSSDIFYKPDGGELFGMASAQITDGQWDSNMNMVAAVRAANLGYRGAEIASTMVT